MCINVSASVLSSCVCVCVMVRAETIFSIVTEAFCSLSPLCHTLDVIVRGGLQHLPAALANMTSGMKGRERLARGRRKRGSLVLYQLLS